MTQPKIKLAESKIDLKKPWEGDKLNRKESAEALTKEP